MRITVFGAGAIGGMLAAAAAANGSAVSAVLRGPHLAHVRTHGLTVRWPDGLQHLPLDCTDDASRIGPVDLVIVATKATAHASVARSIAPLLGPDTAVLFVANGIPWWYDAQAAALLDPDAAIASSVGPGRAIGGVMYGSSTVVSPGVVEVSTRTNRLAIGWPDSRPVGRLDDVVAALDRTPEGRLGVEAVSDLRAEIWRKLPRNIATALPAVLSGLDLQALCRIEGAADMIGRLFDEAHAIAGAAGALPEDDRTAFLVQIARSSHRPSMLQDLDLGRPMEIDAMFTAPIRIGRAGGIAMPTIESLLPLLLARAAATG